MIFVDNIKNFLSKNIKLIISLLVIIGIGIIGYTLAAPKLTNVSIATGNYQVVYSGTATLPSSKLTPILDDELTSSSNSTKVMKVTFTVKGAQTNPTNVPIIYDVSLTDLNLASELHSELLKWRLYKNNTQISEGSFSYDFDSQINNRMVLTSIQQDLPSYSSAADSYTFYIWISEQCTGDITSCGEETNTAPLMNKTLSGNIKIELSTKSKKSLVRPVTATKTIINLASTDACNAGGTGVCATNSYTKNGETKYHDYRFRGADPNNYVLFNNDLYRIIGVFDENSHGVKDKYLIKLITADQLYAGSWGVYNTTNTSGTYSSYKNDWTGNTTGVKANANVLLNEFFYNKTDTSSTYGSCSSWTYYSSNNNYKTFSCSDIIGHGIDSNLRDYIEEVTWYLKGYKSSNNIADYSKQNFYLCERGLSTDTTNCMSANSGAYDASTTSKIGLMYASDYLYASSYFADTATTTSKSYYYGNKNWLYKGIEWTITPMTGVDDKTNAFFVSYNGFGYRKYAENYGGSFTQYSSDTCYGFGVRPTFYLKSNVNVTGGSGTFDDPYTLSM